MNQTRFDTMDEAAFLAAFEDCSFPRTEWTHRPHVTVAYLYLRREDHEEALDLLRRGIQRYNEAHGDAVGYHETATVVWARLIRFAMAAHGPSDSARHFFDHHSYLLNKMLPLLYYTRDRLMSLEAKQRFVAPDLQPLPDPARIPLSRDALTPDPLPFPIPQDPLVQIAQATQALEDDPADASAFASRATARQRIGRTEQALADCDQVVAVGSRDRWLWLGVATVYADNGRAAEAVACLARAIEAGLPRPKQLRGPGWRALADDPGLRRLLADTRETSR